MNRKYVHKVLILFCIVIAACGKEADISGYVMAKEEARILIVNPVAVNFTETGGVNEFSNAAWVRITEKDIQLGEKVNAWYDGDVDDSYPAQATARKVETIASDQPEGAKLKEDEALRRALAEPKAEYQVLAIISIEFDKELEQWNIGLKNTMDREEFMIEIKDIE